jgi:hypothetical protein
VRACRLLLAFSTPVFPQPVVLNITLLPVPLDTLFDAIQCLTAWLQARLVASASEFACFKTPGPSDLTSLEDKLPDFTAPMMQLLKACEQEKGCGCNRMTGSSRMIDLNRGVLHGSVSSALLGCNQELLHIAIGLAHVWQQASAHHHICSSMPNHRQPSNNFSYSMLLLPVMCRPTPRALQETTSR